MTNTPHGQVPEALRLANVCSNLTRYSMDAHLIAAELRRQHAVIAELESELEAVGAGGVQALSAAPVEQEEAAQRLRKTLDIDPGDVNDPLHPRYIAGFKSGQAAGRRRAAPAASPTAEQQAQPGAVGRTGCTAGTDEECTRRGCATSCPAEQAAPKAAPGCRGRRDQIREVFMAHGFTVKEGQTDLKQYVYDAAYALLAMGSAPQPAPESIRSILVRCREFIDTTKVPAYPAGADLADEIDVLLASQAEVDRWDTPLWKDVPATAEYIGRLRAAQAAGQAVVQDDLITLRKPTTSAELLWLLKLAHLVISDVNKTLEETFAPAQELRESFTADGTWHDPSTTEHSSGMRPLFAAPQPVAREPLSDEEVDSLCKNGPVYAPMGRSR